MNHNWTLKSLTRFIRDRAHALRNRLEAFGDADEERRLSQRLAAAPLTHVRCLVPFTHLEFCERGLVNTCCPAYTRYHAIGNIKHATARELWNGPVLRRIRRRILLGETGKVCRDFCPFLLQPPTEIAGLPEAGEGDRLLKEDLQAGRVHLRAAPLTIALANWGRCNLRCKMCSSRSDEPLPAHVEKTHREIQTFFDRPVTLMLTGNGDPLARSDTRQLMIDLSRRPNPNVSLEILTNGLLWTEELWSQIRHCNFTVVNVSVDAATVETYTRIRRGGQWPALLRGLDILRRARDEGAFRNVYINMTVMRSNYREIPKFIHLARAYGFHCDFKPIRGAYEDENIFEPGDRAALDDLARILDDPELYGPDVYLAPLERYGARPR